MTEKGLLSLFKSRGGNIEQSRFIYSRGFIPCQELMSPWPGDFHFFIGYVLVIEFTLNTGAVNEDHNGWF